MWGGQEGFLETLPPDAPARDIPDLWPENAATLRAFFNLSLTRPAGLALGYIQYTEIEVYARIHDVSDVAAFAARIRACDLVYVEFQRQRADAKSQRGN